MSTTETDFIYRLWRYDGAPGELIPLLQSAQEHFGYIPRRAIKYISEATGAPESTIYGVITFYSQFRLQPMGKRQVRLCCGIEENGTTEDGLFTLFSVACLGCCSLAPAMMINDETYGSLTPAKARKIIRKIRREENEKAKSEAGVAGSSR